MHIDDFITKIKQLLQVGSIEINQNGGMKMKPTMKSALLVSIILLMGCVNNPATVGNILTETKTKKDRSVNCPTTMIKVCNGPNRETIARYEDVYCSCHSRRSVERAFKYRI